MEVEVKLRLPNAASHAAVASLLSPHHITTHFQENYFFDTPNSTLTSNHSILRLRFYNDNSRCVASLKSKPKLQHGVSRVEEYEADLDPFVGRACVIDPNMMLELEGNRVLRRVREEFEVGGGLVCLGGFRNVRNVYEWRGLKVELDESVFEFGSCFEIECECAEPEKVRMMIEEFLNENGVPFEYSRESKFAIFRSGRIP